MNKRELKNYLYNYNLSYDYEKDYTNIYNACIDYMNSTQDFKIEEVFYNFIDYEMAEEIAKNRITEGGLASLHCFIDGVNLNEELFKLDGYENLENVTKEDLRDLIDDIIENYL